MFGGHSFNESPPYFAYPDFFICSFRISSQKYTSPSKNYLFLIVLFFPLFSPGDLLKWSFPITKGWPPLQLWLSICLPSFFDFPFSRYLAHRSFVDPCDERRNDIRNDRRKDLRRALRPGRRNDRRNDLNKKKITLRPFLMFGGHSFNENPPYFAYPDFFICSFRISFQKYTFLAKMISC